MSDVLLSDTPPPRPAGWFVVCSGCCGRWRVQRAPSDGSRHGPLGFGKPEGCGHLRVTALWGTDWRALYWLAEGLRTERKLESALDKAGSKLARAEGRYADELIAHTETWNALGDLVGSPGPVFDASRPWILNQIRVRLSYVAGRDAVRAQIRAEAMRDHARAQAERLRRQRDAMLSLVMAEARLARNEGLDRCASALESVLESVRALSRSDLLGEGD